MVHMEIQLPPVCLTVGPRRRRAYIVAYLKQPWNYNGTGVVRRIVMARFKNMTIIMAHIQLTLYSNMFLELNPLLELDLVRWLDVDYSNSYDHVS
jgi:hypothetical protein